MSLIEWQKSPKDLILQKGTLHVWRLIANDENNILGHLSDILAKDEKERTDRFVFDKDKRMFTIARGALRLLLSRYLGCLPVGIEFKYNSYGKPFINKPDNVTYQFNVSHSKNLAVIIVARQTVGIDVEYQDPAFASLKIAERFFSKDEVQDLKSTPAPLFVEHFFDCWSRKESYIKARGLGVSLALDSFTTRSNSDGSALLAFSQHFPADVSEMQIFPFTPDDSFSGAITALKPVESIRFFNGNDFLMSIFGEG